MNRPTRLALVCAPFVLLAAGYGKAWVEPDVAAAARAGATATGAQERGVAALAWMAGTWRGTGLGGAVEEHWSSPAGGTMIGMFRLVVKGETSFTQYMVVQEAKGRIQLRFKHFDAAYVPWEKDGPLTFELIESTPGQAVFQSRDPKQTPSRLVYRDRDQRALSCLIESPQALGGPLSFELLLEAADRER